MNRAQWAEKRIRFWVEQGDDLQDAQKWVYDLLKLVPLGADPETYIIPASRWSTEITDKDIADARAEWMAYAPTEYKRLLDATETE